MVSRRVMQGLKRDADLAAKNPFFVWKAEAVCAVRGLRGKEKLVGVGISRVLDKGVDAHPAPFDTGAEIDEKCRVLRCRIFEIPDPLTETTGVELEDEFVGARNRRARCPAEIYCALKRIRRGIADKVRKLRAFSDFGVRDGEIGVHVKPL